MKKITYTLAIVALSVCAGNSYAQDKVETETTTAVRSKDNVQKEADALETRIRAYSVKIEANKNNDKVNYDAEIQRIAEMKARWETMTGKVWEETTEKK